jgi:acyl-CoA reductase-like NAD-dependent aldehyde dehydrogenase
LVEIETNNYLAKNEVFGPVIALIRSKNTQNSIEIANDSEYGLGACVIGTDLSVAEEVAKSIETGIVFVNDIVKSDSRIPIGGSKCSGIGRECGKSGLLEFTNLKTLWVA